MANSDIREEVRVAVQQGKVKIEGTGGLFAFLKGAPKALPIIDISQQGVRLLSKKKLAIGDKLAFEISIPLLSAKPMTVSGTVAWVKKFSVFTDYLVGVKFTRMTKDSVERLNNLVKFLGTRSQPDRKIIFKEEKKHRKACVICKFAKQGSVSKPASYIKLS